ncbi:peptidoglycan-binding domain-containing protein [Pseudarthrobacter sp. J1763]|uniref:peptidoglycan-binding domain-containing protein n=1 Tax=Pseudarthrobacter sp. J1763 TaxID=3420445 RepID=UPI003D2C98B7
MGRIKRLIAGGALAVSLAGAGMIIPASSAEAYSGTSGQGCTAYQYSRGGYASCIGNIQRMLNGINYQYGRSYGGYGLTVDNSFGPATDTQARRFQGWVGLSTDGVVGKNTWNRLCFYAGQVNFYYSSSGATKNGAWQAAYNAGCYVEVPTSTYPYYRTIKRY